MKWTIKKKRSATGWEEWFAWHPVKVSELIDSPITQYIPSEEYLETWYWFENVCRRRVGKIGSDKKGWQYTTIFELIKLEERNRAYTECDEVASSGQNIGSAIRGI